MQSAGFVVLCVSLLATRVTLADRDHDDKVTLRATLRGAHEVPPSNSDGTGRFTATVHRDGAITFKVTFADLSTNLVVSHIHFAQFNVAGGVMIFLCGGGGEPACPAATSGDRRSARRITSPNSPRLPPVPPGPSAPTVRRTSAD